MSFVTNFKWLLAAVAVAVSAPPLHAKSEAFLYDCTITKGSEPRGWISPRVVLAMQADGSVLVVDSVVLAVKEKPISAKLQKRNGNVIARWTVDGVVDSAQQVVPNFQYRATIDETSLAIRLLAKPVRFPQSFKGSGTCKIVKGKGTRPFDLLKRP